MARSQYGTFHRDQALALGHTEATIRSRLASGRWLSVHREVYRLATAPATWPQALMAACLLGVEGTYVSNLSAAGLWRLSGFGEGPLEVSAPRQVSGDPNVTFRRTGLLPEADRDAVGPLPVSNVTRTLIDIAAIVDLGVVEAALDGAIQQRLTSVARITWRLDVVGSRGLSGAAAIRRLIRDRTATADRTESALERKFLNLVRDAGLPLPEAQYVLRDRGRPFARADFAYPAQRLIVELDGYRYHSGKARWERDLDRRNRIQSLGWTVLNVTWGQLEQSPDKIVSLLLGFMPEQRSLFAGGSYTKPSEQGS